MRILAHRGASADFPENTLEAFEGAVAQRADGVELDVMRCASGELVVCHDEQLNRLAGLSWWVHATPYWKLKKADVGSALGFAPARIPLLAEVFELLPPSMLVNVELKCETVDDLGLTEEVGRYVEANGLYDRVLVSSFNPLCLLRLAARFPSIRRGQLIDPDKSWLMQALWSPFTARDSIHPHFSAVTAERVEQWHGQRQVVAVWTVDAAAEAQRLERLGVDYVITNRPGELR
ncbi:MAG: glycerophosphodiester phosphodiesterase, partial [Myxococcaceae bacterium]|nr:glycerophosphodiester phosphodiesterase [Myxococcaceae bacterium]